MMKMETHRLVLWILVVWSSGWCRSSVQARKADRNAPHPYPSVLKSYQPGPFEITLTSDDEKKLQDGQPVMKQTLPSKDDPTAGGGAICIQDIQAPPKVVWDQILSLNAYKGKVPKVVESHNYHTSHNPDGSQRIKTKMVLGVLPGYNYESYYDHTYYPEHNSLVWKLDSDKTSDFQDVSGHWHVEPKQQPSGDGAQQRPTASRVFYACDIQLAGSVPSPILNYISKAALKQATSWVKKESEKVAQEQMASGAAEQVEEASTPVEPPMKKRRFAFGLGNP